MDKENIEILFAKISSLEQRIGGIENKLSILNNSINDLISVLKIVLIPGPDEITHQLTEDQKDMI